MPKVTEEAEDGGDESEETKHAQASEGEEEHGVRGCVNRSIPKSCRRGMEKTYVVAIGALGCLYFVLKPPRSATVSTGSEATSTERTTSRRYIFYTFR